MMQSAQESVVPRGRAGGRRNRSLRLAFALAALLIAGGLSFAFANKLVVQHRLNVLLIAAVKRNDAPAVERLLGQGADANARDEGDRRVSLWTLLRDRLQGRRASAAPGPPALAVAMRWSDVDDDFAPDNPRLIRALLDHGANPNGDISTAMGTFTPFGLSVYLSRHETIGLLLDHGAQVDERTASSATWLMYAAQELDDPETMELLLRRGANIEATDSDGNTPIVYALNASPGCVRVLLAHHANRHARNRYGETPLSIARVTHKTNGRRWAAAQVLLHSP
jgi:hypothetical protein